MLQKNSWRKRWRFFRRELFATRN